MALAVAFDGLVYGEQTRPDRGVSDVPLDGGIQDNLQPVWVGSSLLLGSVHQSLGHGPPGRTGAAVGPRLGGTAEAGDLVEGQAEGALNPVEGTGTAEGERLEQGVAGERAGGLLAVIKEERGAVEDAEGGLRWGRGGRDAGGGRDGVAPEALVFLEQEDAGAALEEREGRG